jgi:carbonic anhydrase
MRLLEECFEANRRWVASVREHDPDFFDRLRHQQAPELLWIGCADSRIPPDRIIGKMPGEVFVHRNLGNVVVHTDMNCLSVLQFGVDLLGVRHIIVCGHHGCGGVKAALDPRPIGLADNWLRHIRDVALANRAELDAIADAERRADRLSELNVVAQVANVCRTTIVRQAWARGMPLSVHGWIYAVGDGLVRDLGLVVEGPDQIPEPYR